MSDQAADMTKRELVSAMILQGMLTPGIRVQIGKSFESIQREFATSAVSWADALLKALGPDEGYGEPGMCKHYIPDAKERCAICYPEIRGMQAHSPDEGEGETK